MPEILQTFTIVRRLFAPEALPWAQVMTPTNSKLVQEKYGFAQFLEATVTNHPQQPQLIGGMGELRIGDSTIAIQQLVIEPNIVQFQIAGNTDDAERFFRDLVGFLATFRPGSKIEIGDEYTKTVQTIVIAKLTVPFDSMFAPQLLDLLEQDFLPAAAKVADNPDLRLLQLKWQVTLQSDSSAYVYVPKVLTIEPRAGSKLEDRIYYTQSPTDFKTHMDLLRKFEERLGDSGSSDQPQAKGKPSKQRFAR